MAVLQTLLAPNIVLDAKVNNAIKYTDSVHLLCYKYMNSSKAKSSFSDPSEYSSPIQFTLPISKLSRTSTNVTISSANIVLPAGMWWVNVIVKLEIPEQYHKYPNRYRYLEPIGDTFEGGWYKLDNLRGIKVPNNLMYKRTVILGSAKITV